MLHFEERKDEERRDDEDHEDESGLGLELQSL